jgi:hypothetical protein
LAAAVLFVLSWLQPFWRSNIQESGMFVQIRPYGLEHNLGNYVQYMGGDPRMPGFFAPLMWAYLIIALAVLLVGIFVKDIPVRLGKLGSRLPRWLMRLSLPQWLIGGVGVSYIVFVLVFLVYAYIRVSAIGVQFVGESYITIPEFELGAEAISAFEPGFWLACVVGPSLLALGLLRNKIIGNPKVSA